MNGALIKGIAAILLGVHTGTDRITNFRFDLFLIFFNLRQFRAHFGSILLIFGLIKTEIFYPNGTSVQSLSRRPQLGSRQQEDSRRFIHYQI